MSKTDKTRPWRVRALDRPEFLAPQHDHRGRDCDLPERAELENVFGGGGCRWVATPRFWAEPENHCGCPLCSDQDGRRAARRRERRQARREARDWERWY